MKQRVRTDPAGNIYIEQWADEDYPAELAAEDADLDLVAAYLDNTRPTTTDTAAAVKALARLELARRAVDRHDLDPAAEG